MPCNQEKRMRANFERALSPIFFVALLLCFFASLFSPTRAADEPKETWVFLGDSITAADQYTRLVQQALADAKKPLPAFVNAGKGGDTAAGMIKRLDRDVLSKKPTLVTLSAGINDSRLNVSEAEYEKTVTELADRITQSGAKLVIMTTTILGKGREDRAATCEKYDAILHAIAAKYQAPVAEVKQTMRTGDDGKSPLLNTDQVHPTLAGHKLIARALLDALGYRDLPVPTELPPKLDKRN